MNSFGVRLGFSQIYEKKAGWDSFIEVIKQYGFAQTLEIISHLTQFLCQEYPFNRTVQEQIGQYLFQEEWPAIMIRWQKLQIKIKAPTILFSELQLINFSKAIFLIRSIDESETWNSNHIGLGKCLLMINDLVLDEQDSPSLEEINAKRFTEKDWQLYFLRTLLFGHAGNWLHDLPRSHDLYFTDRSHLRSEKC